MNLRSQFEVSVDLARQEQQADDIAALIHDIAMLRERVKGLEFRDDLIPEWKVLGRELGMLKRAYERVTLGPRFKSDA